MHGDGRRTGKFGEPILRGLGKSKRSTITMGDHGIDNRGEEVSTGGKVGAGGGDRHVGNGDAGEKKL